MTTIFVDTRAEVETPTMTRAQKRAAAKAERQAKAEAELQQTLDLVTAMFWRLERGDVLSDAQIAACKHDNVLGVLWWRVWDYAAYSSRTHRLNRIAHDDRTSVYLDQFFAQFSAEVQAWRDGRPGPCAPIVDVVRAQALKDGGLKRPKRTPKVGDAGERLAHDCSLAQAKK
jgi:hypothetical protein